LVFNPFLPDSSPRFLDIPIVYSNLIIKSLNLLSFWLKQKTFFAEGF